MINKEEYKNLISLREYDWVSIEVLGNVGIIIKKKQSVAVTVLDSVFPVYFVIS